MLEVFHSLNFDSRKRIFEEDNVKVTNGCFMMQEKTHSGSGVTPVMGKLKKHSGLNKG